LSAPDVTAVRVEIAIETGEEIIFLTLKKTAFAVACARPCFTVLSRLMCRKIDIK
jgi:hypothetical protein